ncbi:glycerate kinase [Halocynthiibacter sp. C4]|uniref:glycerate kinase type-2 family protein n=1 Tax=Halocynthiibacter sp. C4 TaxID=2992758 RepID=UPI00237BF911|nr:glycerate kinase [Halocynthiibacter sp. C4]MDE0589474.1 glycerate kinase [Halocynthiibacter sp. C4]
MTPEKLLREMFDAALDAADPFKAVPTYLPEKPSGRVVVIGAGKASARMAQAVEAEWGPCEGIVIVPHGADLPTKGIEIVQASHPVPDAAGEAAAKRIVELLETLTENDLALCLISGGGSSLMSAPAPGLSLEDKILVNKKLLASGAAISDMNVLRKHLSATKGGRLAVAAAPARVVTLTISDVPGDDPSIIASGPTVPDTSTASDALKIIERFGIDLPDHILAVLNGPDGETPKPDHPAFKRAETHIVAAPQASLEAASKIAEKYGVTPLILGDAIEGEAREAGKVMAGMAAQIKRHGQPARAPAVLISGGETTVTVTGEAGKGGRCSEFLLGFALGVWGEDGISALACDTDGRDGSEHNAGAIWGANQFAQADRDKALSALSRHDAYSFFESVDGLVNTGPTHTNVNDFRAIYVEASDED